MALELVRSTDFIVSTRLQTDTGALLDAELVFVGYGTTAAEHIAAYLNVYGPGIRVPHAK